MWLEEAGKKAAESREKVAVAWAAYLVAPSKETAEAHERAWNEYQATLRVEPTPMHEPE